MKKRILSVLLAMCMIFTLLPVMTSNASAHGSNGIYGNGTGGVYIDIYSYEFTQLANTPTWGQYAYGPSGCAWFASARQWQLTGNKSTIWSGASWWNNGNGRFGYSTGRNIAAKALACYNNHVAVIEAVSGNQALVSSGGSQGYPNNDYCSLRWVSISSVQAGDSVTGAFLGYVYLGGSAPSNQPYWDGPTATKITETNAYLSGRINFGGGYNTTQCGIRIYDSNNACIAYKDEYVNYNYTYVDIWYDVGGELGVALISGRTYTFQLYAVANGKEYWSSKIKFTTAHTHKYTSTTKSPTCTSKGYTTHYCSCGQSYTDNYTNALGHSYKNGVCSRCGAKSASYVGTPTLKITRSGGHPKLTWNAVDGATKYYIYRSTDGKTYKSYDNTTKTSYTNKSTKIGTTYYYKIKAAKVVNGETKKSAYSDVKSIKCIPATPSLSISSSSGKPKLTWKAVDGATMYFVYRSTDGKTFKYYDSTTKTSYTNKSTTIGKKYYYKIKAVKVVNGENIKSSYSATKSMVRKPGTPSLSITASNGKPKLTWKAVDGATLYFVYRSTDGKTFKYYDSTAKTSYTNKSTTKGKTYYYKIKAVKVVDGSNVTSAYSNVKSLKVTK